MLLSIGMMVKNETKYLKQCLESLKPIREAIECELIIVDTGSVDNTVEIAKQFTDKVYFHEWKNNFSEIRNLTVKYSTGQWFFYIDGDEIVSNPEGIIDFFLSNKYKKSNAACVSIKNFYSTLDRTDFSIYLAPRLFKKDGDFHFEGAVHNQPKFKEPLVPLNSELLHYGYISDDKELMERKFQRTATILQDELKKNPENIYYLFQLSSSYAMHGDIQEAFDAIMKAYRLIKNKNLSINKYLYVYSQLVKLCIHKGKFKETEQYCLEGIKENTDYIDLYYYLAKSQFAMYKNEESFQNYNTYLDKLKNYNDKGYKSIKVNYDTLSFVENVLLDLSVLYERKGDLEKALISANKMTSKNVINKALYHIISLHVNLCKFDELGSYYKEKILINNKELKEEFIKQLEYYHVQDKNKNQLNISKVFSYGNTEYSLLNKARVSMYVENKELIDNIDTLDFSNLPYYYGDLLFYLVNRQICLAKFLGRVNDFKIKSFFDFLLNKYDNLGMAIYEYLSSLRFNDSSIDNIRINKLLSIYVFKSNGISDDQYKEIFYNYLENGYHYLEQVYNNNIIQNELVYSMKDEEDLFLMYMYLAEKYKENRAQYLRMALSSCKYMKKGIEMLGEEVSQDIGGNSDELEAYKKKVKEAVTELINNNNLIDAKKFIHDYEDVIKEDAEICSMKAVIAIMENRLVDAEDILIDALEKHKDCFDLVYNLAYVYEQIGDNQRALFYYKNAYSLTSDDGLIDEINNKIEGLDDKLASVLDQFDMNDTIKRYFEKGQFDEILKYIQSLIIQRKFTEALELCKYWQETVNNSTPIIYYFMGLIYNGLKNFQLSLFSHKRALELDGKLADVRNSKSVYQHKYNESETACIGCNCNDYEIISIVNQSISEDNKEIINPIRIWAKCSNCGLVFANPVPDEKSLEQYYSIIAKEKFGGIYGDIDNRFEFLVSMSAGRLSKIEKFIDGDKRILDIGTGVGIFVGVARDRGWIADGIELTSEDCNYAKEKYDIELIQKNFYDIDETDKYEVVTLFEVIEHLGTPLKDLKRINKLVNMRGLLVVATPIQDSLYAKKTNENNVFWNVVSHLTYFSKNVLINYLNESGFEILEINNSPEGMGRMEFYCRKVKEI